MHFLITAGPTVEDIDPVRFISNRASGKLGFALAQAATAARHRATLIHGPVSPELIRIAPKKATLVAVRSTADMRAAVFAHVAKADCVIMSAAVSDFTPAKFSTTKLKKTDDGIVLKLKSTTDILKQLGAYKRSHKKLILIGFALETGTGRTPQARRRTALREAIRKLVSKNLDAIVLNSPRNIGTAAGSFEIITRGGHMAFPIRSEKTVFARKLVKLASSLSVQPRATNSV